MTKRISQITSSLKQLGEIQVNDWDFMALLHKDIGDLDVASSLRRLGDIRVLDWDFRTALPAVTKLARTEVDLVDLVKKTAAYKVMDWDFRAKPAADEAQGIEDLGQRLKEFLQYLTSELLEEPGHAHIRVEKMAADVLRFHVIVVRRDEPLLIGRGGETASAIRNIMKAAGRPHGVHVLLEILTHEQAAKRD